MKAIKRILYTVAEILFVLGSVKLGIYAKEIDREAFFENSDENRFPQTIVHYVVTDFLQMPLPDGKKEKKVLVMGYDGFREYGLWNILDDPFSSVCMVSKEGGLYHTYAGGDEKWRQETTTSPGWASILTGQWSNFTAVESSDDVKNDMAKTFLMDASQKGISSAFICSWKEHFSVTYKNDIAFVKQNNLPLQFFLEEGDNKTYACLLQLVEKNPGQIKKDEEDPDVIFFTLEMTDLAGHQSGYGNQNPFYRDACTIADACGRNIIQKIMDRETYEQEEWLIIITTDHGGIGNTHGGQTDEERNTWMAVNRKIKIDS